MPKQLFCAQCGHELLQLKKAAGGCIYTLVEPHTCPDNVVNPESEGEFATVEKTSKPVNLDRIFDSFKFVEKLNDLKPKSPIVSKETGDKRAPEHTRKELQTTRAPKGIIDAVANQPNSKPAADVSEEPSDA